MKRPLLYCVSTPITTLYSPTGMVCCAPRFIVQRGAFRIDDGTGAEIVAGPGALIGELALVVAMPRPSTATALEYSSVVRVSRSLFQRVLESDPVAARRLRDEFANRTSQIASDILMAGAKLSS